MREKAGRTGSLRQCSRISGGEEKNEKMGLVAMHHSHIPDQLCNRLF
jgi:hypothetical protein